MGVRGINLLDGDEVVAMQLNTQGYYLLVVALHTFTASEIGRASVYTTSI